MSILEVKHICKSFNKTEVLKDISFSLEKGQVVSIIGSSGSGKTTLLRCLNFLEHPDQGIIRVNGETLFDSNDSATQQEAAIRKKDCTLGWYFSPLTCFPSTPPFRMSCWQGNFLQKNSRITKQEKKRSTKKSAYRQKDS